MSAIIGIRREDKNRWERRVALTPAAIKRIMSSDEIEFAVQPSPIRVFKDDAYEAAGCDMNEYIDHADVIFAVKEIPMDLLVEDKPYVFFSHVIKGQDYNMPLLQKLLDLRCTTVDYEKITDDQGRRLVFFGRQAGQAGMIETLFALGKRLKWEGYDSPFSNVKQAYMYDDLNDAKHQIRELGINVRAGLDPDLCPLIVGFAGYGNVSQGAQEVFDLLPHQEIEPDEVADLFNRKDPPRDRVFKVVFKEEDLVEPKAADGEFELQDYYRNPHKYRSRFEQHLPHLTALVNCIYWTDDYPRLVTKEQVRMLWSTGQRTLRVIGDISCDINGSVEFTHKATEPDTPSFIYDPITASFKDGTEGRGIIVMPVDNLPCELPRDASEHFSQALERFAPLLARADYTVPFPDLALPGELKRAIITYQGKLTPDYRYLEDFLTDD
ncbi:MAG: hypothetical protein GY835_02380 [bacterium]|nr:hypothetical protein [bacterium]